MPRYRPGPASAARTWVESDSGSKTSSVPRISTAFDPPSTKNAARGPRLAMRFLAAYREVVIQSDPAAKLYAAGLTSGRRPDLRASIPICARPRMPWASRLKRTLRTLGRRAFQGATNVLQRLLEPLPDHPIEPAGERGPDHRSRRYVCDTKLDPNALRRLGEREAALLLDEPRLRIPSNLLRPAPADPANHAPALNAQRHHLDVKSAA